MRIETLMNLLPENFNPADRELIMRAYRVAEQAHRGQKRASGELYINHCIIVAGILAEMRVPPSVLAAGLLHDTVEDTDITLADLNKDFGEEIARLVDGVTKLTQLPRVSRADHHLEDQEIEEERRLVAERRGVPDPELEAAQMVGSSTTQRHV